MPSKVWTIAAIVLGCGAASEIGLRHFFGLGDPILIATDPACGYIVSPNQHKIRFGTQVDINEFGMRSGPVLPQKRSGNVRILLVGDSILYGTSRVGQKQIFAALLQEELPAILHRSVEILNVSASGWAISNETDYVRSRGIFGSDLVVLVLNSGDLSQARANLDEVGGDFPIGAYACAWCEVWARFLKPRIFREKAREDVGTTVENDAREIAANLRRLDEFRSTVAAGHARMGIVYIAVRRSVADGVQESAQAQLVHWAQERQVPLLDLTRFETRVPTRDLTLDGIHLTVSGNRVVATAIENNWRQLDPQQISEGDTGALLPHGLAR